MSKTFKSPRTRPHANVWETDAGTFVARAAGIKRSFPTLAQAIEWRDETKVDAKRGTLQRDTQYTLTEYFENVWLRDIDVRKPTLERYEQAMRKHIIPVLGDRKLEDVIAPDLDRLVRNLIREGMKPSSALTTIGPLKSLLTHAFDERVLRVNEGRLMKSVDQKKQPVKPVKALDEAQLAAWFAAIPDEFVLLYDVLLGTGARISEVLGLTFEQIGPDAILIDRRWASQETNAPKNGQARSVPISKGLANKLSALRLSEGEVKVGLVFPNARGSHWSDVTLARRALDPVREATGLTWVTFHSFRHTYVTRAYANGVPLGNISAYLGHATPQFTWREYHSILESNRPTLDWMDRLDPSALPSTKVDEPQSQSDVVPSLLEQG